MSPRSEIRRHSCCRGLHNPDAPARLRGERTDASHSSSYASASCCATRAPSRPPLWQGDHTTGRATFCRPSLCFTGGPRCFGLPVDDGVVCRAADEQPHLVNVRVHSDVQSCVPWGSGSFELIPVRSWAPPSSGVGPPPSAVHTPADAPDEPERRRRASSAAESMTAPSTRSQEPSSGGRIHMA